MEFNGLRDIMKCYAINSDSEEEDSIDLQTIPPSNATQVLETPPQMRQSVHRIFKAITNTYNLDIAPESEFISNENININSDNENQERVCENKNATANNNNLLLLANLVLNDSDEKTNNNNNNDNIKFSSPPTTPTHLTKAQLIVKYNKQLAHNLTSAKKVNKKQQQRSSSTLNENATTLTGQNGTQKRRKNKKRLSLSDSEIPDDEYENPTKKRKTGKKLSKYQRKNSDKVSKERVIEIETNMNAMRMNLAGTLHYAATLTIDEMVAYTESKPSDCMSLCLMKNKTVCIVLLVNFEYNKTGSYNFRAGTILKRNTRRNQRKQNSAPPKVKEKNNDNNNSNVSQNKSSNNKSVRRSRRLATKKNTNKTKSKSKSPTIDSITSGDDSTESDNSIRSMDNNTNTSKKKSPRRSRRLANKAKTNSNAKASSTELTSTSNNNTNTRKKRERLINDMMSTFVEDKVNAYRAMFILKMQQANSGRNFQKTFDANAWKQVCGTCLNNKEFKGDKRWRKLNKTVPQHCGCRSAVNNFKNNHVIKSIKLLQKYKKEYNKLKEKKEGKQKDAESPIGKNKTKFKKNK